MIFSFKLKYLTPQHDFSNIDFDLGVKIYMHQEYTFHDGISFIKMFFIYLDVYFRDTKNYFLICKNVCHMNVDRILFRKSLFRTLD